MLSKRFLASGSSNVLSCSSIAMGDSWLHCKSAVLTAKPAPWMRRATVGRPLQKHVQPVPISTKEPSSGSLVSLRAAMSKLYLASSQAMSAVRRRAPNPVSCRVLSFQKVTTCGLCFIEEFILYFFRPRVGYPCGCGRPTGNGGTGNVWATFSWPLHHWRWAVWSLRRAAQSSW